MKKIFNKSIRNNCVQKDNMIYKEQKLHIAYIINVDTHRVKNLDKKSLYIKDHYRGPMKYENVYNYTLYKALMSGFYNLMNCTSNEYHKESLTFPVKKHWIFEESDKTHVFNKDFTFYYDGKEFKGNCVIKIRNAHPSCYTKLLSRSEKELLNIVFKDEAKDIFEFISH